MLGDNRPNEIAPGDELALGFPKILILRIPIQNPGRAAHCVVLSSVKNSSSVHPRRPARRWATKKPCPEGCDPALPQGQRRCCRPIAGPCGATIVAPLDILEFKVHANSLAAENPSKRSEEHTSELQSRENLVCR